MSYEIRSDYRALHDSGKRSLQANRLLCLHSIESTNLKGAAEGAGAWFADRRSAGSAHYGVDNDSIQRYLSLDRIPWAAPSVNLAGIHYEQMGTAAWTRAQWLEKAKPTLDRTAWLLARHSKRFAIPLRTLTDAELRAGKRGVITHVQATRVFGGTHTDPGKGYPIDWVMDRARHYLGESKEAGR
jgi:hypothetical protein